MAERMSDKPISETVTRIAPPEPCARSPEFDSGRAGAGAASTLAATAANDSGDSLRVTQRRLLQAAGKTSAERTRRYRARRKQQLRVLPIEVDECDLADFLLASGLLDLTKADDPAEMAAALSRLVSRWISEAQA